MTSSSFNNGETWAKRPQSNRLILSCNNLNTVLKDRRIIDDLINTLDSRNMSEIAVSDILSSIVSGLYESETESKQKIKSGETRPSFIAYLFALRLIPNTKT